MRNIAGIIPKWKDIRIADIVPNGSYLHSNADIPKLAEIPHATLGIFKNMGVITLSER